MLMYLADLSDRFSAVQRSLPPFFRLRISANPDFRLLAHTTKVSTVLNQKINWLPSTIRL